MYFCIEKKRKRMKIAIVGYGKMGKAIEQIAIKKGHEIVARINIDNVQEIDDLSADVAIEFSQPKSATINYKKLFDKGIPVVSGTTGWLEEYDVICNYCNAKDSAFFYASNFSIGVNIFFRINKKLASLLSPYDFKCEIEETHHKHKLDKPSGTAISLANDIINNQDNYVNWELKEQAQHTDIPIRSFREGEITGMHQVKYTGLHDEITIKHNAINRNGFALGAVLAAEFLYGKKGIFNMDNLLQL
jgi:4-hydroxy-tetrahydrodipicolinate reductase